MIFEYLNPHPHGSKGGFLNASIKLDISAASHMYFKIELEHVQLLKIIARKTDVIIVYARMDVHFWDGNFFVNFPSKSNAVDLQIVQT